MFHSRHFSASVVPALVLVLGLIGFGNANASIVCVQKPFYEYGADIDGDGDWDSAGEGPTRNTSAGICCAVATANSFAYLWNHYPDVYGDTNLIPDVNKSGGLDVADLDDLRNKLAYGWDGRPGGMYGSSGSFDKAWWQHKVWWIEEHAPGTTIFDGQDHGSPDIAEWHRGEVLENKYPEWAFLYKQLLKCEDIELGMLPYNEPYTDTNENGRYDQGEPFEDHNGNGQWDAGTGAGHCVTLTGLCFEDSNGNGRWDEGETPQGLRYLDPNGDLIQRNAPLSVGEEGRLQFVWWDDAKTNWFIDTAFSESPIPEPASIIVWSLLAAIGIMVSRRRKRGAA